MRAKAIQSRCRAQPLAGSHDRFEERASAVIPGFEGQHVANHRAIAGVMTKDLLSAW
jgi:hypothetical protein